ncbi:MAG: hypothetical protein GXP27_02700, partial [Planctomycetes bacterium]|nr:hypothetical protein [Planctomycetota bacterium]
MHLSWWLDSLGKRLRVRRWRRRSRTIRPQVEICEDRTLLSVSASFFGPTGQLTVNVDAGEDVTIQADPSGNVEILVDGSVANLLPPVGAGSVNSILLQGADGASVFDVSGVTAAAGYQAGLGITLNGGHGDDTLIGSPDFATVMDGGHGNDSIVGGTLDDTIDAGHG